MRPAPRPCPTRRTIREPCRPRPTGAPGSPSSRPRSADELARDAGRLPAAWAGPAAAGCRAELGAATRAGRVAGRAAAPVRRPSCGRTVSCCARRGPRSTRLRTAVRRAGRRAHRRDLTALLSDGSWPGRSGGCRRRTWAGATARAGGAAPPPPGRAGPGGGARAARRRGGSAPRPGRSGRCAGGGGTPVADREAGLRGPAAAAGGEPPGCRRRTRRSAARCGHGSGAGAAVVGGAHRRRAGPGRRDLAGRARARSDGLPAAVRSAANERRLDRDVDALQRLPSLTPDQRRWLGNCLVVRQQLAAPRAARGPAPAMAQLLVFDPTAFGYEGRAAIAVGDVDTADNVAFLVPGLGSDVLDGTASLTGDGAAGRAAAHRVAPTETTATVAWLGYDAPGPRGGVVDEAAEDGAEPAGRRRPAPCRRPRWCRRTSPWSGTPTAARPTGVALRDHPPAPTTWCWSAAPGPDVDRAARPARPGRPRLRRRQQPRPGQLPRPVRRGPGARVVRGGPVRGRGPDPRLVAAGLRRPLEVLRSALRVAGQHRARRDRRLRRSGARAPYRDERACCPTASTTTRRPTVSPTTSASPDHGRVDGPRDGTERAPVTCSLCGATQPRCRWAGAPRSSAAGRVLALRALQPGERPGDGEQLDPEWW